MNIPSTQEAVHATFPQNPVGIERQAAVGTTETSLPYNVWLLNPVSTPKFTERLFLTANRLHFDHEPLVFISFSLRVLF